MLSAIKASFIDVISISDGLVDDTANKNKERWIKISSYVESHEYITNANVRELFNVSSATANCILSALTVDGKREKVHVNVHWAYRLS